MLLSVQIFRDGTGKDQYLCGHRETVATRKIVVTVMVTLIAYIPCQLVVYLNMARNPGTWRSVPQRSPLRTVVERTVRSKL